MSAKNCKIVMTTMFRNEAKVIRRMLDSCYKYIDYAVIQNNGSTDGTDQIVKDFFEEKQIPLYLYNVEEGWVGFGWNRDHLTVTCQSVDHGCDWILKMDCDEVLEVDDDFDWSLLDDKSIQSFHIAAVAGSCIYYRAWMWNANLKWRFNHDPCHETIYLDDGVTGEHFQRFDLPQSFRQIGYNEGQSWSNPTKFISDALILEEKMIKENTFYSDMYHFWYVGKSYYDAFQEHSFPLGDSQRKEFARRCAFYFKEYITYSNDPGINEMCYMGAVFAADCLKFIGETEEAITILEQSERYAPERNDHLFALAFIYNETSNWQKMFEVTSKMMQPERKNPFPKYVMMIDRSIYVDSGTRVQELFELAREKSGNKPKIYINTNMKKKLFVVDDFYLFPDEVRNIALQAEYTRDIRYYKGQRSKSYIFPGLKSAFESIMGEKITKWDENGVNGCFQITTAEDPQVYHHDMQKWAAMIYLTPNAPVDSGTRLHRSKLNGTMHMSDEGIKDAFAGGFYDSTKFDTIADAGNLYNRLVIMDAQNIHSAGNYFGQDNQTGRLTHLFFFD
jgi:glycosyltransferase involved in cell wall biosynthesis